MDTERGGEKGRCSASALSEHPDSAHAVAEVTAQVLARLGPGPELAVFFVTPPRRGAVGDIADVVSSVLRPVTLLGAAAVAGSAPGGKSKRPCLDRLANNSSNTDAGTMVTPPKSCPAAM